MVRDFTTVLRMALHLKYRTYYFWNFPFNLYWIAVDLRSLKPWKAKQRIRVGLPYIKNYLVLPINIKFSDSSPSDLVS